MLFMAFFVYENNWFKWVIQKDNWQSGILIWKLYFTKIHQESNQFSGEVQQIIPQKFYNVFMLQHEVFVYPCSYFV